MLFLILPAYNEAEKIGRVIRGLFERQLAANEQIKVVVVDDGSTDKTAKIAKAEGAVVLRHKINRGQGAALQTGNEYAIKNEASIIVHFDSDGQFNPEDIAPAIKLLKENDLDIVLGSRFLDARTKLPFSKRHIILPVSRWLNYLFTGVPLTDAHNGFRVLGPAALAKIKITYDRMAHNTEIVGQIKKYGLKFVECPVEVKYYEYGLGPLGGLKIIWDLIIDRL